MALPRPGATGRRAAGAVRAHKDGTQQAPATNRRELLGLLGLLGGLSAAQAAKAADPYEELRDIAASRTGSSASLLESFEGTKGAVSGAKASRGIREKLGAQAANAPKPRATFAFGGGSGGSGSGAAAPAKPSGGFKLASPVPSKPAAAPAASAPQAAPRASAAAALGGGGDGAFGPLLQAAGVLGVVGVGANVASNIATSKPKYDKKPAAAAPSPAPQPSRAASPAAASKPAAAAGGSRKVATAAPAAAASRPASPAAARPATVVKKVPAAAGAAAAASGSTVKTAVRKVLVNEEAPDQPTDAATGGFLGAVGLLAAFLLFGLPKPTVVEAPPQQAASNPLVQEAKQAATTRAGSSYVTPLFKAADEDGVGQAAAAGRRAIIASSAAGPAPKLAADAAKVTVAPLLPPKPAAVEAPKAAAAAPKVAAAPEPAKPAAAPEAPKVAAAAAPAAAPAAPALKLQAAAPEAPKKQQAAAEPQRQQQQQQEGDGPSAAQNLLVVAGGIAVVVTAFALTGSSSETSSASGGTAAAGPAAGASDAATPAAAAAAAESVSTAASAAAASAPAEGAQQGNAAYDKAVLALMADPDVTEDLMSVLSSGDEPLKNIPALAWALISTPSNAEQLDGFAFQKLPKQRYERVRALMTDMGLDLPDTPRAQPGPAATLAPAGAVSSSDVDPERLRGVFEALLANDSSRALMRQLLKGAGMPFNEEAFEEQVKDSSYFNLAIAPILRNMPQQKLRVLAELQDPAKLQQLVSSVSSLAMDSQQMQAVTAELSSDVRLTVDTIRAAEQRSGAAAGSASSSSSSSGGSS